MFHSTLTPNISNAFEGFCILQRDEEIKCLYSFPSEYSFQRLYEFIFPCNCPKNKSEEYCIVISNACNDRSFLLCRYSDVYQSYLCVYSYNPWYEIFSKLLFNLSHGDFMPDKFSAIEAYLQQMYSKCNEFQFTLPACKANDNNPQQILIPSIKYPCFYDKYVQEYLTAIKPSGYSKQLWLEVFWSMLLERPIIFMSKRYQKLTSSLLAATFFIHPLSWLHKFISIIPHKNPQLLGMNCCMLGIHSCMEPILARTEFWNEALLVDLDKGESKMVGASENQKETENRFKIPKFIKKFFISHIQLVDDSICCTSPHKIKDLISNTPWHISEEETMYNDYKKGFHIYPLLFRTIISMIIGNYRQFISVHDKKYTFEKEKFIKYNPKLSEFLTIFVQSQCFDVFIDEKLKCFQNEQDMNDRFDRERQELTFDTKTPNTKKKGKKKFRKEPFTGKHNKTNNKSDKISTMPYPKKKRKDAENSCKSTFHIKSLSLSSSVSSMNSIGNIPQGNDTDDWSHNSGSLEDEINRADVMKRFGLGNNRTNYLSIISSHTVSDPDDTLITPTFDRTMHLGAKSSPNIAHQPSSTPQPTPRSRLKEKDPSGQVHNIIQRMNEGSFCLNNDNSTRKKPATNIPFNSKPVSQIASIFEPKQPPPV